MHRGRPSDRRRPIVGGTPRDQLADYAVLAVAIAVTLALASMASARADAQHLTFHPVVEDASFPTNLAVAPDGRVFYSEKDTGRIRVIDRGGALLRAPFATLPVASSANGMGLLGLALHPDFGRAPWVYAYFSDAGDGHNHLVRIRANAATAATPEELLTLLSTEHGWHNGGDLAFGPDGDLYVSVGDGHVPDRAQDPGSLGGKILRLADDGAVPADDPFAPESPVYALGIRNSFGVCVAPDGALWATDIGPSESDELNRIQAGGNYGWPEHLGPGAGTGFVAPILAWREQIVPTGCAAAPDGSVYVGDFHGHLHHVSFPRDRPPVDAVVATFDAGITDVARAPDGRLYVATADGIWIRGASTARGPFTPAGILILAGLIGLLLFTRRRLDRR